MKLTSILSKLEKLGTITKESVSITNSFYEEVELDRTNDNYSVDMGNGYSIEFSCESKDTDLSNSGFIISFDGKKEFPKNLTQAIKWCGL